MGVVEVCGALASKLEVLSLVLADGDVGGAVDKDVGGHEHGVGEEAKLELGPRGTVVDGCIVFDIEFALDG